MPSTGPPNAEKSSCASSAQRVLQFEHLTQPFEWTLAYRQRGLPAWTDGTGFVLLRTSGRAAAIHMPAPLGRRVQDWLRQLMVAGPVLARPVPGEPDRWTFLATPTVTPRVDTAAAIRAAGATLLDSGTPILLPSSTLRDRQPCWWVEAPEPGRELPLLSAVICAVRVCAREFAAVHR